MKNVFEWFWDWLDRLDGNVDGAVFGLGKAVKKLDKAIAAQDRIGVKAVGNSMVYTAKAEIAMNKATIASKEAERAKRVKAKVEELLN